MTDAGYREANILHLEDNDLDAELTHERLLRAGLRVKIDRAMNRSGFLRLIQANRYELVLADFQVPGFDGFSALELAKLHQPDVPFVFLSGAIGEEVAIEALKRGATDYVLKQRTTRLPAALERALAEARQVVDRKKAQEQLRVSEQALAEAQRIARVGSWTWNAQTDGITASAEYWRIFCGSNGERAETFSGQRELLYPVESWNALHAAIQGTLANKEPFELDIEAISKSGPIWLTVRGEAVVEGDTATSLRGTIQDVTERKNTEELIRFKNATTALLRAAVESANDAVLITEANLDEPGPRIEYVNSAFERMTGYTFDEAVRTTPRILQGPKTDRELLRRLRRDLSERQEFSGETTNYRKDGTEYVVEWRITPVRDEHGVVDKWVAVQRDVTDRRQTEEALRDADRRKDEFLATLAHELRNPLAPIRNGLAVLRLDERVGADDILTMMDRQLSHMVRLVDDLLDVSRVISGKVGMRRELVGIDRVIESAIETSRPLVEAGHHQLELNSPAETLLVSADPTRLAQVFSNLLNNSAKYSPDGGRIELAVQRAGGEVMISVRDYGVGIPEDMLPRVFDLFTQVGRTLDRAQGGLGIGLSLVKRLVELHGGRIQATSGGPGKGSVFTVWLPLAHERRVTPRSTPAVPTVQVSRRILVVDDNQDGAASMAMMLRLSGHETLVAHDGYSALAAAREFEPEVVLLDIGMPGMSGYEVARKGRADGTFTNTVLVAVTGWGSENDKLLAREAGFDFHLTKPVEAAAMTRLLGEAGIAKSG